MLRKLSIAILLFMCIGCSERSEISLRSEQTSTFDVAQAKEAFVRDYTAAVEARSETTRAIEHIYYTLADTDYTPLWDKATTAENEHVLSIDVPLYSVSGAFASDTDGENMRMATQKLVFTKSKKDNNVYSYLLTLCPDAACAEKYSDLSNVFTHLGDCSKFSGLAIYTSLAGELVAVNKFVNGTETGYVYVGNPEADQHALHHQAEHLMEGMKFYLSSTPITVTRGGGESDPGYENLCRKCLSDPCICMTDSIEWCPWCGKPYEYDVIFGKCECDNIEEHFCGKCGQRIPKDGECNCSNDPSMECPTCHKQFCTCNPCPLCGNITCNGDCGRDTTEQNLCEYCGRECGGTCEAFCPICHRTGCTEHK